MAHTTHRRDRLSPRDACTHLIRCGDEFPRADRVRYEQLVGTDPVQSIRYTLHTRARFPAGEAAISGRADTALQYLRLATVTTPPIVVPAVVRTRMEAVVGRDPALAYQYAAMTGQRFPAGEAAIATRPDLAVLYATQVLGARFPAGEAQVLASPSPALARQYLAGVCPLWQRAVWHLSGALPAGAGR